MRGYPSQLVKRRKWTSYTRKIYGILPIISIGMNALKRGAECVTFAEISIPEFCNKVPCNLSCQSLIDL